MGRKNFWGLPGVPAIGKMPANAGDIRDMGLIPGLGRSSGGGNGNPLHYSCSENPMDRGAWQARVHGVAESDTTDSELCKYMYTYKNKSICTHNLQLFNY